MQSALTRGAGIEEEIDMGEEGEEQQEWGGGRWREGVMTEQEGLVYKP